MAPFIKQIRYASKLATAFFAVAVDCSILERTSRLEIRISYRIFRRSLPAGDIV